MARKLFPAEGRLIVKLKPIAKSTGFVGLNGEEIIKPDEKVEEESITQNQAWVVAVGPPRKGQTDLDIKPGDEVIISRSGSSAIRFEDNGKWIYFWLIPYEAVQGIWREVDDVAPLHRDPEELIDDAVEGVINGFGTDTPV